LVSATAWWALARPADKMPGWLHGVYGVWLFGAPWLLGFSGLAAASWNAWLVGVSIVAIAWWMIAERASVPVARANSTQDRLTHGCH
jgi:hypothetical protein